jgi:RNA polymerase sigma-70 factor (ECF subfamily)
VTEETDNELMYLVRSGEVERLADLYDRYQGQLFGFFNGMTKNRVLSADLVQNVFYRILKYRQQFQGGQFKSWMFHIARNVYHDQYRNKNNTHHASLDDYKEVMVAEHQADGELHKQDQSEWLKKAMAALSDDKREIILLSKYQEKNYKEIGEILGCTEGNVKVKVFRALHDLKRLYKKYESNVPQ